MIKKKFKIPQGFCWGNQDIANFLVSLQKYLIPLALYVT